MLDRGMTDTWERFDLVHRDMEVSGRAGALQLGHMDDQPGITLPFGSSRLPIYLPLYIINLGFVIALSNLLSLYLQS
jgi:hypothetical protein